MKQNPGDAEFLNRSLNVVEAAALDGSETVRRIQTFARLRPEEQFIAVDVNQIVQDAVAITRPRWEEKIAHDRRPLHLRLDVGTVESIHGRPAALTEAMTNLILNALDAMPDGGTLRIATRQERGGPDRKSTRLNSSHGYISYAVFCLKKKKPNTGLPPRSIACR